MFAEDNIHPYETRSFAELREILVTIRMARKFTFDQVKKFSRLQALNCSAPTIRAAKNRSPIAANVAVTKTRPDLNM